MGSGGCLRPHSRFTLRHQNGQTLGAEDREIDKFQSSFPQLPTRPIFSGPDSENKFIFWEHPSRNWATRWYWDWRVVCSQTRINPGDVVMFVSYVGILYARLTSLRVSC